MDKTQSIHGTAVALNGRGALIIGKSGTGKSTLARRLMVMGAQLVSDDIVILTARHGALIAYRPEGRRAAIEVRNIGIFDVDEIASIGESLIHLVIDLDRESTQRHGAIENYKLEGVDTPMIAAKGLSGLDDFVYLFLNMTLIHRI